MGRVCVPIGTKMHTDREGSGKQPSHFSRHRCRLGCNDSDMGSLKSVCSLRCWGGCNFCLLECGRPRKWRSSGCGCEDTPRKSAQIGRCLCFYGAGTDRNVVDNIMQYLNDPNIVPIAENIQLAKKKDGIPYFGVCIICLFMLKMLIFCSL